MHIKETTDLKDIFAVECAAFGHDEEAKLVEGLLKDSSAKPVHSLMAYDEERAVGHIVFTRIRLPEPYNRLAMSILAPLAVVPEYQKQGIGSKLVEKGLELLSGAGVDLVFVLGHIEYYPRFGFKPAGALGLDAPYPIPEEVAAAWMVLALSPGLIGVVKGKVICADALNKIEYWRE